MLAGIDRLYIMQEPDAGGTAFVTQIARKLEAWQWSGKAFVLRLEGAKDPNELHQQDRQGFRAAFQQALDQAEAALFPQFPNGNVSPPQHGQPSIFSLPDLLSWELPPVRWTIPEILPEGLTLAGRQTQAGEKLAGTLCRALHCGWRRGPGRTACYERRRALPGPGG